MSKDELIRKPKAVLEDRQQEVHYNDHRGIWLKCKDSSCTETKKLIEEQPE